MLFIIYDKIIKNFIVKKKTHNLGYTGLGWIGKIRVEQVRSRYVYYSRFRESFRIDSVIINQERYYPFLISRSWFLEQIASEFMLIYKVFRENSGIVRIVGLKLLKKCFNKSLFGSKGDVIWYKLSFYGSSSGKILNRVIYFLIGNHPILPEFLLIVPKLGFPSFGTIPHTTYTGQK